MAEGGYNPTNENETPWEDHGIDYDGADDDDDEEEVNTTQPFQPGASSTPYHGGEEHEMANMGPEEEGLGETVPLIPQYDDFVFTEDTETLVNRFKAFIKAKFPRVDFSRVVVSLGKKQANQGKAVALGPKGGETVIFKQDNTFTAAFTKQYSGALGKSAEELVADKTQEEKDLQSKLADEVRQVKESEKPTTLEQKTAENVQNLTRCLEQTRAKREGLETEHGSTLEQQNEIDRLKQLERNLTADLENETVELKQLQKRQNKTLKEARQRVGKLKQNINAITKERDELELGLNRTKPLNELEERYETLKRENEEDRKVVDDDNATESEKQAATGRIIEREEELERLAPQIQEREEALPLRERVKNIFKKYGWTLQAVALAVGVVLSALALAGQGLKTIGQKLGSLLPGLIGSIVSFIFKATGQVFSFLAEHAWLLIVAVVAFFMERMLKRRRKE